MPKNQSLWLTDDNVVGDELASKLRVHLSSDGDGFIDFGSSKTFNIRKGTSTKLQIRSDGKVNIDSLQIVGGALPTIVYVSSGTLQAGLSDARLKNNITDLEPQLHKLNEIRCRRFDWRETGGHDIGLIAQELECIYPDLVFTEQDDYKGIYHDRLTILLLKSVQELASRVAHLESFINI